jgi:glycosyltransferase involved in cell wall biosynthesis
VKLLFLLTQSLDYPSGLGRYWPLAKELVRLGHQVRVAALHPALGSLPSRRFDLDGIGVSYVGPMHVRQVGHERLYHGPLGLAWAVLWGTAGLSWEAMLREADAIHVCKPHPMNGLAGLSGRWLRRRRLYLDCDDYEAESNRYSSPWQREIVKRCEDGYPRFARGVTTNTRFTQRRLERLGYPGEHIVYVPNGIDRERFSRPGETRVRALRRRLGLFDDPVVLYVGSLSSVSHPLDLLLGAFVSIAPRYRAARLLIVGGGEDYGSIRRQVQEMGLGDRIVMTGRVDPQDVPLYYAVGDVSVDPVHDDPTAQARSPLKLFESMATGTAVLTGDVGDRREHLGDGRAGLLVEPGSAETLAEGLAVLLDQPGRRQEMGKEGQALAERFYWDVQVREFVRVYER